MATRSQLAARHLSAVLTEFVYAENGWFWCGWGERLASVEYVEQATEKITAVLRDNCSV